MSVKEYIQQKFQSFGIELSEADTLDILLSSSINEEDAVTQENINQLSIAICKFIPTLLLHPSSLSESGFSISKAQSSDIRDYYSLQCKKLGIENELKSKITFL